MQETRDGGRRLGDQREKVWTTGHACRHPWRAVRADTSAMTAMRAAITCFLGAAKATDGVKVEELQSGPFTHADRYPRVSFTNVFVLR